MSIFPCHYSCYPLSRTSLPPPSYRLGNLAFQHVYKADYCSLLKSLVSCEQVISTKRCANPCAYSDCDLVHCFRFSFFSLEPLLELNHDRVETVSTSSSAHPPSSPFGRHSQTLAAPNPFNGNWTPQVMSMAWRSGVQAPVFYNGGTVY